MDFLVGASLEMGKLQIIYGELKTRRGNEDGLSSVWQSSDPSRLGDRDQGLRCRERLSRLFDIRAYWLFVRAMRDGKEQVDGIPNLCILRIPV